MKLGLQNLLERIPLYGRRRRVSSSRWAIWYWMFFCSITACLICYFTAPTLLWAGSVQQSTRTSVTQTFRYHAPEAGEVYLVWGIDDWQVAPETWRPPGSVVEYGVMYTPMKREGDTFVAQLQLPSETVLTYGFQTRAKRNGTPIEWIWDGDYQQNATTVQVIERQATVPLPNAQKPESSENTPLVKQEFHYRSDEAGEVYFVWGVNGWQEVPETSRPPGTVLEFGVMHTPMTLAGDTFITYLQLPAGTVLDYGFQTRKKRIGTPIEWIWDGNFVQTATQDTVISIEAKVTVANAKESTLDFTRGPQLLVVVSILFAFTLLIGRIIPWAVPRLLSPSSVSMGISLSLFIFLLILRAHILGFHWISLQTSTRFIPVILASAYYDLVYVSILAIFFFGLLWLLQKYKKRQWFVTFVYGGIALLSLLISFVNIKILQMIDQPISYQWLYYADFLMSADSQNVIEANLSPTILVNGLTISVGLIIAVFLFCVGRQLIPYYPSKHFRVLTTIIPLCLYLFLARWQINPVDVAYTKLANPIIFFLESIQATWTQPQLFTMQLSPADLADFQPIEGEQAQLAPYQTAGKIQNVILFVMESVGAEYLEIYGGDYPVTPELNQYRQQTLLFNNIYAGAPASNKSLFSLVSATYDLLSYSSLTQINPTVPVPTVSSELARHGYRTAFFSAGDNDFQRGDEFLAHRQFDTIQDYHTLACTRPKVDIEWAYSDGVDEECLIDAFSNWQSEQPAQPFFAMMWTIGTHYPYFVMGEEVDYGVNDPAFNRYLNALQHTDQALGRLLRLLEKQALLESTLVVVVSDHGEAFGRHDQMGHAEKIYEENVHVPLLFINPNLFQGEENATIGGHIDIAPTILHLLNLPAPTTWQGQSLFSQQRSGRTYFFAPWSDFWFGYREGNLKFLFNATDNRNELYDLLADPYETKNLADQMPEYVLLAQRRLAAWVQQHEIYTKKTLIPREPGKETR